jgi:asparagine synthase (glutamine-hydrolysing)
MCGIYGIINLRGEAVDGDVLAAMGAVTRHRGPDDLGSHVDGNCAIGMTRLSIIDLAGGHQPIPNEDGTLWLVCNGEVYNFRELRDELKASGHRFRTGSDSEILLHAYEQWGDRFVDRLNGMFGFALWDGARRRLLIGRDRLGIKPIYVYEDRRRLVFATEAKAILTVPGVERQVDPVALQSYLQLGYVAAPHSLFAGIRKLPVATVLAVEAGRVTEHCYWRMPSAVDHRFGEAEWAERVRTGIERSVRMQMVSDVPIGAFLSGGIDSSAVVGFMAKATEHPIRTYSIGFEGGPAESLYNELPYARRVADLFGTDHHEIVVKPDVVGLLPRLLWHMDEPIADSAFLTTYLVSEFARREVTVILSGVGGDELFGGYRRYLGNHYADSFARLPGWVQSAARAAGRALPADRHSRLLNKLRLAKGFLASSALSFEDRYAAYVQLMPPALAQRLLRFAPAQPYDPIHAAFDRAEGTDVLNRMLVVDGYTQLPDDLLLLTDKMSMTVSLECRVPLLDHELVELAATMPESIKVRGGRLKHVMKLALADLLPPDILHREKRGFGTPIGAWLKGQLSPVLDGVLGSQSLARRGLFEPAVVAELIAAHRAQREDYTDALLALMNFEVWARLYLDGRSHQDVAEELKAALP